MTDEDILFDDVSDTKKKLQALYNTICKRDEEKFRRLQDITEEVQAIKAVVAESKKIDGWLFVRNVANYISGFIDKRLK